MELHPEQFGMSKRETSQMAGRAIGEHLYESLEKVMTGRAGGFKLEAQAKALKKMRDYPEKHVRTDADGDPEAHITTGNWTSTWHGGGYVTHNHKKHGAVDATNLTDYSNPEHGPFGPGPQLKFNEFKQVHNDFIKHAKTEYPKEYQ